ncbi:hypothetical protein Tco_1511512, partial [Tanacetum coccineum]
NKYSEEDQGDDEEVDWIDSDEDGEKKDDIDADKSIDFEMIDDEETNDEFVHGVEQAINDEDEEMTTAEVEESMNGDEENTDAENTNARKIEEVKDDAKKAKLPPTSSSLSVSSGFSDQFLKLSSDTNLSSSVLRVPAFVIYEPSVLSPVQETPLVAPVTTLHLPSVSTIPHVPHQTTAPIPITPITIDAPTITNDVLEFDALSAVLQRHTADLIQKYSVKPALESNKIQKPTIDLEQESEKRASEIHKIKREQTEKKKMPKYTINSTDKAALKEYDQKSALYQTMHKNKYFNKNPANHALYHALMEVLIEDENVMDKGVADTVKNNKTQHDDNDDDDDDDEDPSAGPNQGTKIKRQRTKESESSKKPFTTKETPKGKAPSKGSKTVNTTSKDVVRDDDQPQDTSEPKTNKTPNQDWFKQPSRPLLLIRNGRSVKLYLTNLNSLGLTKWSLLQMILLHLMI